MNVKCEQRQIIIIGGGPAGLTAGYQLVKNDYSPLVLEQSDQVGGIAKTEIYKGYRFDIGGHRFFTKVGEVNQLWQEVLGDKFIQVPRLSRIFYDGKFFDYPISVKSTLSNLGVVNSYLIIWSYLREKVKQKFDKKEAANFEEWVIGSFGERLYNTFFKTYTEKVWGIPCTEIQAEWAQQRIKGMSLKEVAKNTVLGKSNAKSLITKFDYPILGPGQMWEAFADRIDNSGGEVKMNTKAVQINHENNKITSIQVQNGEQRETIEAESYISSMPISTLLRVFNPQPPQEIIDACNGLSYRDFLIVALIIDKPELFPDNWIYIHSPDFSVGRIQNFKNWSPKMVPDLSKTCLGMEYFCSEGDRIWESNDEELIALATKEIDGLGLAKADLVKDATVLRQKKAYPVYDRDYYSHLQVIREYLKQFTNLQTVGRNGMHRYNNQDHSMLTGLLAAKNIMGENHDLWQVNVERSYYENFTDKEWKKKVGVSADN